MPSRDRRAALAGVGRPEGYLARQLRRWEAQLAASHSRDLPDLVGLGERLGHRLPARQGAGIVHGDYRLDNVVVDASDGRVVAVLDWEMATLGDPLTDLASTVVWWDGISGLDRPVAAVPGDVPGFPASGTLVEAYGRRTGGDLDELPWYLGFAYYKIAAIFEASISGRSRVLPSVRASTGWAPWCRPSSSRDTPRSLPGPEPATCLFREQRGEPRRTPPASPRGGRRDPAVRTRG